MLFALLCAALAQDAPPPAAAPDAPVEVVDDAPVEDPAPPEPPEAPAAPAPASDVAEDGLPTWYPRFEKERPPATHRLFYRNSLFARMNPLGLQNILDLGWRYQLVKKTGLLYGDSYVFLGAAVNASPSFMRGGVKLEVMPISLLRFEAKYQGVAYLGSFDNLTSFPGPNDDFSDRTMGEAGAAYVTTGGVLELGQRFQLKIGGFALRNNVGLAFYHVNLKDGDAWFYEQFWDRMTKNRGWILQNDLDVMGVIGKTRLGVRYTYSDTLVGDGSNADLPNHRVGPIFAFEFHDRKPGARFNHPTLFILAQWWAQHVYRSGQQQPVGLPLIAVGLSFDGDLIGPKPPR